MKTLKGTLTTLLVTLALGGVVYALGVGHPVAIAVQNAFFPFIRGGSL
jgi:hypothetical protein